MKKFILCLIVFFEFLIFTTAQQKFSVPVELSWSEKGLQHVSSDGVEKILPYFNEAYFSEDASPLPTYHYSQLVSNASDLDVDIRDIITAPLNIEYDYSAIKKMNIDNIKTKVTKSRNEYWAHIDFTPIIFDGSSYRKITSFTLDIKTSQATNVVERSPPSLSESVLANGDIYKLAVQREGMHALSFEFLTEELGIEMSDISPSQLQIYGAGGGMLPEINSAVRVDDLKPIAMKLTGMEDGVFNAGDKIIFFAEAATVDKVDIATKKISAPINFYDTENFYFLKVGNVSQNIIEEIPSIVNTTATVNQFDDFIKIEEDNINILFDYQYTQGSGTTWYMQKFEGLREQTYDFSIPNLVTGAPIFVESLFAGRSDINTRFDMIVNGQSFRSGEIGSVRTSNIEAEHAKRIRFAKEILVTKQDISVTIDYPHPQSGFASSGWLDYISINAKRRLILEDDELIFRSFASLDNPATTFNLQSSKLNTRIWNITNPLDAKEVKTSTTTGTVSFGSNTTSLQKFIAFDAESINKVPTYIEKIKNQNLHALDAADMIVVYPKEFVEQAKQYAEHRRNYSQLDVKIVQVDEVYNEYSSGRKDPAAIRDFCRILYDRDPNLKYLLLFGDGSFDFRGIYTQITNKSDFIPVYEVNSLNSITSYPMDDFFGLLDPMEGGSISGSLDLAMGRFPVKTVSEAQLVVNKIIDYETKSISLGNWRNDVVFVADDEDSNTHINDADGIAEMIRGKYQDYNINKLYADSYVQLSTPGGEKYPRMTEELNKVMFQGALMVNYLGHGGSKGWAQERFLDLNDIDGWTNKNKLPLLVTATCSFTGFDDPAFVTAGERTFINSKGGAIGLMTTVRAVYASSNERLARSVFERIFEKENGQSIPFGDVMIRGKNLSNADIPNSRKFTLIGDPSMRIAIPKHKIQTLSINGNSVNTVERDTIHALDQVTVTGQVTNQSDQLLDNFNGKIFIKVFDKINDIATLANDPGSKRRTFKSQKNLIFKGAASVKNGLFSVTFVVPKDINYEFGNGKISYYATDEVSEDATGFYTDFIVGGTNPDGVVDNEPPKVEVFMNDVNFVLGGITSSDPILLVKLSDNLGINVAGSSIGHDLTGTLNQNSNNVYALNDFYEADIDDFTQGTVRFPLFDLESGRHEIKVRAWDVANNSAEGYTEFIVAENQSLALEQVLNYPNPFTTNTQFMFEHNLPGQLLDIQVRIFTVSGKLVKSLNAEVVSNGNSVRNINWDGKDDFGADIARGVYLYKIKAAPSDNTTGIDAAESEFEKLVILK